MNNSKGGRKAMALLAVALTVAVLFAPAVSEESDAATWGEGSSFYYTISSSGAISGSYTHIGSSSTGKYTSTETTNSGSWAFDATTGYGPFNSYYAAFDPAQNNKMIAHLNPYDLTKDLSGNTISSSYNIMWCLPTVYWNVDSSGNLILSSDEKDGTAYAHTINGHTYKYIAIGVYEAGTATVDSKTILTSQTGVNPLVSATRATFRDYANNQSVNTNGGDSTNGYAMVWNFYQYELYKYCALAVMGGWDSQSIAGNGSVYGGSPYYKQTGLLNSSGPYAGTRGSGTTYYTDSVKVFIENAWGSVFDFVDGVVVNGTSGMYIDTSAVPTDAQSAGTYVEYVTKTLPSSGWINSIHTDDTRVWGVAKSNGASSSSGLYDYIWTSSGAHVLYVGGCSSTNSSNSLNFGLSSFNANHGLSYSTADIGGRLALVYDADPASGFTASYNHTVLTAVGGSAENLSTASSTYKEATTITLPSYGAVTVGDTTYVHTGWATSSGGSKVYDPGASYELTKSVTLYSLWEENIYLITYNHDALTALGQDSSSLASTATVTRGDSLTMPDLGVVGGYVHTGWVIDGSTVAIGSAVTPAGSITAYSTWKVDTITLTFMVEGEVWATLEVPRGTAGVVYTPVQVTGVFMGWYYDEDFTSKYDSTAALTADDTLYAKGVLPLVFTSYPTASASITNVDASGLYYFDATDSVSPYKVYWDFGDGNTSTDIIAYNTYSEPGTYEVTLTVENLNGEKDTRTYTVNAGGADEDGGSDGDLPWATIAVLIAVLAVACGFAVTRFG